ncbi:hypothetical protein L596_008568 [Steinernema carpocapsae]|uniref:Uncharacterized protein n=1 Tax=Steinernema carpocapsae TaxID=34508 RepID=A0A4U5PCV9_STECR|nr:hypothetical protein L596_008568 [Steinernema carpocapsae]
MNIKCRRASLKPLKIQANLETCENAKWHRLGSEEPEGVPFATANSCAARESRIGFVPLVYLRGKDMRIQKRELVLEPGKQWGRQGFKHHIQIDKYWKLDLIDQRKCITV